MEIFVMLKATLSAFVLAMFVGSPVFAEAPLVSLRGFTVAAPEGNGWNRIESGEDAVRFERKSSDGLSSFEFAIAKADATVSDDTFLKSTEAKLEESFVMTGLLSRHYNYTRSKGVVCLAYDGILGLKSGPSKFKFLKGLVCRLPSDLSRMARLEAVRFANDRNVDKEGAFLESTDSLLQTTVFVKAKD